MISTRNLRKHRDEEEWGDDGDEPIYVCGTSVCTNNRYHEFGAHCVL